MFPNPAGFYPFQIANAVQCHVAESREGASLETGTASIADIAGALAAIRDTKKA
jgi:hypothetical protein